MSDDMGASADADRAVAASPSSPTVSPVPASIPSAGVVLCDWCAEPVGWQPISTVPMKEAVLLGSYYDEFRLRPPFEPIWQTAEGHAFEWQDAVEFSLRGGKGALYQAPTHWRRLLTPPPYAPSAAQIALTQGEE